MSFDGEIESITIMQSGKGKTVKLRGVQTPFSVFDDTLIGQAKVGDTVRIEYTSKEKDGRTYYNLIGLEIVKKIDEASSAKIIQVTNDRSNRLEALRCATALVSNFAKENKTVTPSDMATATILISEKFELYLSGREDVQQKSNPASP